MCGGHTRENIARARLPKNGLGEFENDSEFVFGIRDVVFRFNFGDVSSAISIRKIYRRVRVVD